MGPKDQGAVGVGLEDQGMASPGVGADEQTEHTEERELLLAALDVLPFDQREAFVLFYIEEMSVSEISELQGVSEDTVRSRLRLAREKVEEEIRSRTRKRGPR
jgi:RNA polymerase sigma-70 factor (ECF subfamily)